MRYSAAAKLEIIKLVEHSPLPVRYTVGKLGIPPATFYRWYDRYSQGGPEALAAAPRPSTCPSSSRRQSCRGCARR